MVRDGKETKRKFNAVMKHGRKVLREAKLKKRTYKGECEEWGKWRMVLQGREYPPVFKTYEDWSKAFGRRDVDE